MAIRAKAFTLLFILLCSSGALFSIWQVRNWGNDLSLLDLRLRSERFARGPPLPRRRTDAT